MLRFFYVFVFITILVFNALGQQKVGVLNSKNEYVEFNSIHGISSTMHDEIAQGEKKKNELGSLVAETLKQEFNMISCGSSVIQNKYQDWLNALEAELYTWESFVADSIPLISEELYEIHFKSSVQPRLKAMANERGLSLIVDDSFILYGESDVETIQLSNKDLVEAMEYFKPHWEGVLLDIRMRRTAFEKRFFEIFDENPIR